MRSALAVLVVLLAGVAVSSPVRGAAAPDNATYTDPAGDRRAGTDPPDVTAVTVSTDPTGLITMIVSLPNLPTLRPGDLLGIYLDTDQNSATGSTCCNSPFTGIDYSLSVDGTLGTRLVSWSGTTATPIQVPSLRVSYASGLTFQISGSDIGNPTGFKFVVTTANFGPPLGQDRAPDSGTWAYPVAASPPPPPPPAPAPSTNSLTPSRTLSVRGPIEAFTADGQRAVFCVYSDSVVALPCDALEMWDERTGAVVWTLKDTPTDENGEISELVLAGTRLAWTFESSGNTFCQSVLEVFSVSSRVPRRVESRVLNCRGNAHVGYLAGDRSLLVFNTWFQGRQVVNPKLWKLVAGHGPAAPILSGRDAFAAASVDSGRIAIQRPDGAVEVLDSHGHKLRSLSFPAKSVRGVALTGTGLVLMRQGAIEMYDPASGRRVHRWPVPLSAQLEDAEDELATYVAGTAIHAINLSNGHDLLVQTADEGGALAELTLHAQLTSAGLFFSYNGIHGYRNATVIRKPAHVVFVSMKTLRSRLL
jgi:hypothetical protein